MAIRERKKQEAAGHDQARQGREGSYRMKIGGMSCSFCTERFGALAIRRSDVVVNMPFLTWPGGQR